MQLRGYQIDQQQFSVAANPRNGATGEIAFERGRVFDEIGLLPRRTFRMRRPGRAARKPRATVSTSGSSGTS